MPLICIYTIYAPCSRVSALIYFLYAKLSIVSSTQHQTNANANANIYIYIYIYFILMLSFATALLCLTIRDFEWEI